MPTHHLAHHLPEAAHVARTLSGLVGRAARCTPGKPVAPATRLPIVVATYLDGAGNLAAVALLDLSLACSAGAALVMLPRVVADEGMASGGIPDNIGENLHEVLNVWSGVFNSPSTPRVKLGAVTTSDTLAPEVAALAKAPSGRLDLEVAIPGYAAGRLTLLVR